MPERVGTLNAVVLGLCSGLLAAAPAPGDPVEAQPFALLISIEMAVHRRLVGIMDGAGHRPEPFVTDGCSGGLSASWDMIADSLPVFAGIHENRPPREACCVTHDRAYHGSGGASTAEDSYRSRLAADAALRACVRETGAARAQHLSQVYGLTDEQVTGAYAIIADAMFDAVRLGGGPCSGLPWRWGYGYPGCLSDE